MRFPFIFLARLKVLAIILLVYGILALLPSEAKAARFSGDYLVKVCALDRDGNELVSGGKIACQSYISAVIDYHNFLRTLDSAGPSSFCLPDEVSLNEIHLVVLLYFMKNQKLHRKFIAAPGVEMALIDAYPCEGKKRKKK